MAQVKNLECKIPYIKIKDTQSKVNMHLYSPPSIPKNYQSVQAVQIASLKE